MRVPGRTHRIDCNLEVSVGAVLEAHRTRKAGRELPVDLTLGGACADGAPAHQVCQVLRGENVEKLHSGGNSAVVEGDEQLARHAQSLVYVEAAVQVGIVDEALPADRGAWFLEVDPHHDEQIPVQFFGEAGQALTVLSRGDRVVNRARPGHHQKAIVLAMDNPLNRIAGAYNGLRRTLRHRKFGVKRSRGGDFSDGPDAKVLGRLHLEPLV